MGKKQARPVRVALKVKVANTLKALVTLGPFVGLLFFSACSSRPVEDLALADVALKAAQRNKADMMAPDAYRKAENYYLRAKKDYQEGYFDSAKKNANEARMAAEQSEYQALLKQSQVRSKTLDEPDLPPPSE